MINNAIQFPFRINQKTEYVNLSENIRQSILMICLTKKGSIVADRNFGSKLHLLLFEPNNAVISALAYEFISQALAIEKRITIKNIETIIDNDKIIFSISYIINTLQTLDNVNYSFNRI